MQLLCAPRPPPHAPTSCPLSALAPRPGPPQALQKEFGPLEAYDVTQLPYPGHHLPGAKLKGFPMKPYALLHSK